MKNNFLHIAIVQQSPVIGGAETYMYSLIQNFKKEGHSVFVATNEGKYFDFLKDLKIHQYKLPFILDIMGDLKGFIKTTILFPFSLWFYIRLLQKFKDNKVNVILSSGFTEKLLVTFLSIFFDIPVVWIEYGPLRTIFSRNLFIPKFAYCLLKNFAKFIIVPSENTKKELMRDAGISLSKLVVIPCGTYLSSKQECKRKDGYVIGNVSRLTREKGQQHLIAAMPEILKVFPQAKLIIAGGGSDEEYFKKIVFSLGVEKNVEITGFIKDLTEFFSKINIFVFPSAWELEGFGVVTIEAMAHKLPVVASNYGPIPEIVDNNKTGLLVHPKDPKEIAKAIVTLLKDKKKQIIFGQNGYDKVKKNYLITDISAKITKVLRDASIE